MKKIVPAQFLEVIDIKEIINDLFNISGRLKSIDSGYKIFFNCKLSRFEIHNTKQNGNSLCLVLPFDQLDSRTVELVKATACSRIEEILSEVENKNNYLNNQTLSQTKNKILENIL